MNIVQLSTSDLGGAGIAAKSLHQALLDEGVHSTFVTRHKMGPAIKEHFVLHPPHASVAQRIVAKIQRVLVPGVFTTPEQYFLSERPTGFEHYSLPWSTLEPFTVNEMKQADIVHLHWVSDGFVDYGKIFTTHKKYVWTLHDMNPFTGGCHHSDGCMKFSENCNYCPQLKGTRDEYLSGKVLRYKIQALQALKDNQLVVVAPSQWLAGLSKKSTILGRFEHRVIRNVVSIPAGTVNRHEVRKRYGIKETETVFLFVAHHFDNPRKGIGTLLEALGKISNNGCRIVTVGEKMARFDALNVLQLGYINDRTLLKEIYTMADAFVLPSLAENFPNTIAEALLCGTPVIASKVGGITEQINPDNGLLVDSRQSDAWTEGLSAFLSTRFDRALIAKQASEAYNPDIVVKETIALYKGLIGH